MTVAVKRTLAVPTPEELVGVIRRLGAFGPVYKVTGVAALLEDGDATLDALLPESGETFQRLYSRVLRDPTED